MRTDAAGHNVNNPGSIGDSRLNDKPHIPDPDVKHDVGDLARAIEDPRTGSWAMTGLFMLAILTVLYLARDLMLPIVTALILSLVLLPAVRGMKRLGFPVPLGAGIVVLGLVAAIIAGTYRLAEPAGVWLDRAPQGLREIEVKIRHITGQVKEATKATDQVQDMTADMAHSERTNEVTVKSPTLADRILAAAREFALASIVTLVLLYFLLASGDLFLRKTIAATPRFADKKRAVDIAQQIEAEVSSALLTVTIINVCLGSAVALAMYLLGVPNPLLWGVMVGVLNFIPYLGDIVSLSVLTMVGLLSFDNLWHSLLVPAVFSMLTAAEGYFITPMILGRRLSLNPVVIVVSVLFWGWMWGILGALLAVPILVAVKTLCDRIEALQVFGDFLGA